MNSRLKRHLRTSSSRASLSFSYTKLEPRQLLSADFGVALHGNQNGSLLETGSVEGGGNSEDSSSSTDSRTFGESTTLVADYVDDFQFPTPNNGWAYLWNEGGDFGTLENYEEMIYESWRYRPDGFDFPYLGATFGHSGSGIDEDDSGGFDRFAIASYTVSEDGEYSISDSLVTRDGTFGDGIEVAFHINSEPLTELLNLAPGESGSFDMSLGFLSAGDTIYIGVGPDGPGAGSNKGNDAFSWDFSINQTATVPVSVTVDLETQRYVGDTTALDRSKYFTFHSSGGGGDQQIADFQSAYDVGLGRQFWGPLAYAKQVTGSVGSYPNTDPSDDQSVRDTFRMVQTTHPRDALRWDTDLQAAADWVTTYYTTVVDTVPEFFEPMNEPFVHAGDSEFSDAPSDQAMREKMAELYAAIGEAVDNTPALADLNVVGYASAWPSVELWDFDHWETRMKMFMDVAGDHMDAFSTHLYDGVNVTGQNNRRSGSNSEAILDLIETYSYTKWGEVIPHAITEFGGIEDGYGETYSDIRSAQSLRSINHLLFNLLERENDMLISIPFISDKAEWFIDPENNCEPYGATLWRLDNPDAQCNGEFVHTWRINFFELWKDVQGERGLIETSDPDVQTQLFVDGNTAYVAINNLADQTLQVDLEFISGLAGLQDVEIRHMEVPVSASEEPTYTETTQTTAPENISLNTGGTAVLVYNFDSPVEFTETIRSEKYYTSQHLEPITADQTITFNIDNVQTASNGSATLRMGIGRKHGTSKTPDLTVNGVSVEVPLDWKGYDQANRDDFFGVIDIDVPIEILETNNIIEVTFPDDGGRVSSMILNVEAMDADAPVDRFVFYNQSSFDGASNSSAIAPDKSYLVEGQTATFANYSSYVHGINGVIVDLENPDLSSLSPSDFEFKFGNDDNVDAWPAITPNVTFSVEADTGIAGSDRVLLEFENGTITNGWLQVRVLANDNTRLNTDDVFYFGNAIGDTGNNSDNAIVNLADVSLTRSNQTGFSSSDLSNVYDFNRDESVNLIDVALARQNQSGFTPVNLITPTSGSNRPSSGKGKDTGTGNNGLTEGGNSEPSLDSGISGLMSSTSDSEDPFTQGILAPLGTRTDDQPVYPFAASDHYEWFQQLKRERNPVAFETARPELNFKWFEYQSQTERGETLDPSNDFATKISEMDGERLVEILNSGFVNTI